MGGYPIDGVRVEAPVMPAQPDHNSPVSGRESQTNESSIPTTSTRRVLPSLAAAGAFEVRPSRESQAGDQTPFSRPLWEGPLALPLPPTQGLSRPGGPTRAGREGAET